MDLFDRRSIVAGIAASGCCGLCGVSRAETRLEAQGCLLQVPTSGGQGALDATLAEIVKSVSRSTGVASTDVALDRALVLLSEILEVRPGFAFYDDRGSPNALATPSKILSPEGSVFFGRELFQNLVADDSSGASVMYVAAHEFGHILQYKTGVIVPLNTGRRTVKRSELHADFMAGFYLGVRKLSAPEISLRPAGAAVWSVGDNNTTSEGHHGKPAERLEAAERGFLAAYEARMDLEQAFAFGFQYAMTTPPAR